MPTGLYCRPLHGRTGSPIRLRQATSDRPGIGLDHDWFFGLVATLIGVGQLPVALSFAPDRSLLTFVVGSAGLLLVAVGSNLFRGRPPFASDWSEDGVPGPVGAAVQAVLAAAVVVASVMVVVL